MLGHLESHHVLQDSSHVVAPCRKAVDLPGVTQGLVGRALKSWKRDRSALPSQLSLDSGGSLQGLQLNWGGEEGSKGSVINRTAKI